jgi:hypothetical protein
MAKSTPLIGEVACDAAPTKAPIKPTPERLPPPETRFRLGGRSFEEMQQGRYRAPEEVLGMAMPGEPSVTSATDFKPITSPSCKKRQEQAQAECIEALHEDTEETDPPLDDWEEDIDGEFYMRGKGLPYVSWSLEKNFICTSSGGHLHEILSGGFRCLIDGDYPDGYQYRRDGMDMFIDFGSLSEGIEYVEREIEYQYKFERTYWPWVLRLPAEDRALVLAHARYCVRIELLEMKYSIPNKSWLARRAAPISTTDQE